MASRLFAVVLACGCGAPPAVERAAITNGVADGSDPAVVAIVSNAQVVCSGSLIGPHTVLTAAHCQIDGTNFDQFGVSFGEVLAPADPGIAVTDARPHPRFDPTTFANDLTLLTLAESAPPLGPAMVTPLPLDARAVDASFVGQTFATVGFGRTAAGATDEGTRRTGVAKVSAVGALDFTATPSPSQPCGGDSGGAALFSTGGQTFLTGVTSHGDANCSDRALFARIDVQQSFFAPYFASIGDGSVDIGGRCFFQAMCKSGSCLQAPDEPKRRYCSNPCSDDGACSPGMECVNHQCVWTPPSPGALGARCAQDSDCVSAICWMGACARACVATGNSCPAGYQCSNAKDITFYCVASPRSGCEFGGAPSGGVLWLLLLGFLLKRSSAR